MTAGYTDSKNIFMNDGNYKLTLRRRSFVSANSLQSKFKLTIILILGAMNNRPIFHLYECYKQDNIMQSLATWVNTIAVWFYSIGPTSLPCLESVFTSNNLGLVR